MRRSLPPLNYLKAFEAAARHENFTKAAQELCVTQGAVSQQVKLLESQLGLALFHRQPPRLALSEAGREYLGVVSEILDRLALGTERLVQNQRSGRLTVSTSPDFAAKWLVHRLGRFTKAHPEIDIRVSAAPHRVDFTREEVDVAVRHGEGSWSGLNAVRLTTEQHFAVCSPLLLTGRRRLRKPADVLTVPLLHLDDRKAWASWFDAAGVAPTRPLEGPVWDRASMLIDAAIDGQGVALARTTLAAWDLLNGRLIRPFPDSLPISKPYWIVCPEVTSTLPKIKLFQAWLLDEAAADLRALRRLGSRVRAPERYNLRTRSPQHAW